MAPLRSPAVAGTSAVWPGLRTPRVGLRFVSLLGLGLASACSKDNTASTPAPEKKPIPLCVVHDASKSKPVSGPFTVVQLTPELSPQVALAVHACAGLYNRKNGGSVYVDSDSHDVGWLSELGLVPASTVSADVFLNSCVTAFPSCVAYNYKSQQVLLPNILTVASVLGAVPVDASLKLPCVSPVFDAVAEFADKSTPLLATQYVFEKYASETTGLAMLNPGYDQKPTEPKAPAVTQEMKPALVDFVFSERLFAVFLVNGCIDGHPEKAQLSSMVNGGKWATPLAVYGYNNSWNVAGGYLYEAQTRCLDSRNMGAVASEVSNLSFFATRASPITGSGAVTQNQPVDVVYNPQKTYVAFVVGDGDNIQYMMTTRRDWFEQRVADCEADPLACPPLTWSISPHLARLAPDVLGWYYAESHKTKRDHFVLPPSGHLYAYPSSLAEDAQNSFVEATEVDACILGLTGTVHWDWSGTWHDAEDHFIPKYATLNGSIRGVFPVNVPYAFPTFTWWPEEQFFRVLRGADGGKVALFRPRSWRGVDNDKDTHRIGPQRMADELGEYPKGTVTWVYMTSDGGLNLQNSFLPLAKLLPSHVELVSTDMAAKLAIASAAR